LNPSAVDVELVMGIAGRGSYCRDTLDTSRLLDLYALLGVPLRMTLGYPAAAGFDADADPELSIGAGHWHGSFSPAIQSDWAADFAALAMCKPFVQGLSWAHLSDSEPHQFPNCGLVDGQGQAKPALRRLGELRAKHLL
jgi:hypothetical protein